MWWLIGAIVVVALYLWWRQKYVKGEDKYFFRATVRADEAEKIVGRIGNAWQGGKLTNSMLGDAEKKLAILLHDQRSEKGAVAMAGGHRDAYAKIMEFSLAKVKDIRYNGGRGLQEIAQQEEAFAISGVESANRQIAETKAKAAAWGVEPPSWMQELPVPQSEQSPALRQPTPEETAALERDIEFGREVMHQVMDDIQSGADTTLADICFSVYDRGHGLISVMAQTSAVMTIYRHLGGEETATTKDAIRKVLLYAAEYYDESPVASTNLPDVANTGSSHSETATYWSGDEDSEESSEHLEIGQLISSIQDEVSEGNLTVLEVCRLVENESEVDWSVRKRASIVLSAVIISSREDLDTQRSLLEWAFERFDEEWSDGEDPPEDREFVGTERVLRARLSDPVVGVRV